MVVADPDFGNCCEMRGRTGAAVRPPPTEPMVRHSRNQNQSSIKFNIGIFFLKASVDVVCSSPMVRQLFDMSPVPRKLNGTVWCLAGQKKTKVRSEKTAHKCSFCNPLCTYRKPDDDAWPARDKYIGSGLRRRRYGYTRQQYANMF